VVESTVPILVCQQESSRQTLWKYRFVCGILSRTVSLGFVNQPLSPVVSRRSHEFDNDDDDKKYSHHQWSSKKKTARLSYVSIFTIHIGNDITSPAATTTISHNDGDDNEDEKCLFFV
jgi:hypothetical protein